MTFMIASTEKHTFNLFFLVVFLAIIEGANSYRSSWFAGIENIRQKGAIMLRIIMTPRRAIRRYAFLK